MPDFIADHATLKKILTIQAHNLDNIQGFIAPSAPFVGARVFGGQLLAQALLAAYASIVDKSCHSLHAYFLHAGDANLPIFYHTHALKDGTNFATRTTDAYQLQGSNAKKVHLFSMQASFCKPEQSFEYQKNTPSIPPYQDFTDEMALRHTLAQKVDNPHARTALLQKNPLNMRPTRLSDPFNPSKDSPKQGLWFLPSLGDSLAMRHALIAFMSDYYLLGTALIPHGKSLLSPDIAIASLDHSLHFYDDYHVDWLYYAMQSPILRHGRALADGEFWQDGRLVASARQEGLVRIKR